MHFLKASARQIINVIAQLYNSILEYSSSDCVRIADRHQLELSHGSSSDDFCLITKPIVKSAKYKCDPRLEPKPGKYINGDGQQE